MTAHSHFRYGTIQWEHGEKANEAVFTVNAAFRKEYNWGAYNKVCHEARWGGVCSRRRRFLPWRLSTFV